MRGREGACVWLLSVWSNMAEQNGNDQREEARAQNS